MKGRKHKSDNNDDLLLFKELHKREKDRLASLFQPPVSDEFEPNNIITSASSSAGNYALYKINNASGKRGSAAYELISGENDKNDYDWLKTPPATPLFPSLEMEANASQLVFQREIPIVQVQPLSRFASGTEVPKKTKTPIVSTRSITPASQRPLSKTITNTCKPNPNPKMAQLTAHLDNKPKLINQKQTRSNSQSNNNNNNNNIIDSRANKPTADHVVSPRQFPGFSNDAPPNLRTTDRAISATRGRPAVSSNPALPRRQSCSPSVTRGRKETTNNQATDPQKGKFSSNKRTQIFGSRMVDKIMNARKLGAEERSEAKPKPLAVAVCCSNDKEGGIGRIGHKSSSLDMALKNMEIKRDHVNPRHFGFVLRRNATGPKE